MDIFNRAKLKALTAQNTQLAQRMAALQRDIDYLEKENMRLKRAQGALSSGPSIVTTTSRVASARGAQRHTPLDANQALLEEAPSTPSTDALLPGMVGMALAYTVGLAVGEHSDHDDYNDKN